MGDMNLVTTFELALDVAYVRKTFRPFDLFSKLRLVDGRLLDFDLTLYAQWNSPRRSVQSIDEIELVHPSQLICQYVYLISGRNNFMEVSHMLPVLIYFLFLGESPEAMANAALSLKDLKAQKISLVGRDLYINGIQPEGWAWMEKQIRRVEQSLFGRTRKEVEEYLEGFIGRAGKFRTVGNNLEACPVPAI